MIIVSLKTLIHKLTRNLTFFSILEVFNFPFVSFEMLLQFLHHLFCASRKAPSLTTTTSRDEETYGRCSSRCDAHANLPGCQMSGSITRVSSSFSDGRRLSVVWRVPQWNLHQPMRCLRRKGEKGRERRGGEIRVRGGQGVERGGGTDTAGGE